MLTIRRSQVKQVQLARRAKENRLRLSRQQSQLFYV